MTRRDEPSGAEAPSYKAAAAAIGGWGLGVLRYAADLAIPPLCLSCHQPLASHGALCPRCWKRIDFIREPVCDRLGLPLPCSAGERALSAAALRREPDFGRARAVALFDGVMRDLIHKLKYADRHEMLDLFAPMLRGAGRELLAAADCLVPVPLHRWRLLRRRFNQAALLARRLGQDCAIPVVEAALRRMRQTPSQVDLSWAERRQNVAGAFAVAPGAGPRIAGRHVLLIDDVITTGATAEACAQALKSAGAREVDVLALALVPDPPRQLD
jgi:ComF family protein